MHIQNIWVLLKFIFKYEEIIFLAIIYHVYDVMNKCVLKRLYFEGCLSHGRAYGLTMEEASYNER